MLLLLAVTSIAYSACQKGPDDPAISFRSRESRIINTWVLEEYIADGRQQDLSGTYFEYDIKDDNGVRKTTEGALFGVPIRESQNGTWNFKDNKQDIEFVIENQPSLYDIIRLSNDELWLQFDVSGKTYVQKFGAK